MTSQFSPKVSEILAFSREEAARLSSTSVTPEHLLLGMMRQNDGPVSDVFKRLNINKEDIKFSLEMNVQQSEGFIHPENPNNLELNDNASNILKLAVLEARLQHVESVDLQHVLLAILHDRGNNGARKVLEEHNMNYDNVQDILKPKDVQNPTQTPQASQPAPTPQPQDALMLPEDDEEESLYKKNERTSNTTTDKPKEKSKTPVLDNFSTDLTKAALDGKSVRIATKVGENGQLFGSVNNIQVADALKAQYNYDIDRKKIVVDGSKIKEVGTYNALVNIYRDIKATLNLDVVNEDAAPAEA